MKSNNIILYIIFGMGIIPLFIGLFLYMNPHYLSGKTTERGELLSPPLDARPWFGEPSKWQMLLLASKECTEECKQMLYYGRQVHEALKEGRQRRVSRVLFIRHSLADDIVKVLNSQSPPLNVRMVSDEDINKLFSSAIYDISELDNNIFIIDPKGNLMLRHRPVVSTKQAKDLLRDLNFMLRVSRIG